MLERGPSVISRMTVLGREASSSGSQVVTAT